jgi:mannuronan 5-epimerase
LKCNYGIVILAFVLVTTGLDITLLISQNIAFNVIPFYIHEAKAIKHKTFPSASHASNETNAIPYSSQSNTASPGGCVSYNTSTRTITVSCSNPTRLTDIANKLQDTALTKQSPDGTWLLSANLVIAKGGSFSIDSTDTKWLKISSEKATTGAASALPYNIDVHGSLKIDSVKVTSWDPTTNNYSITNGSREAVSPGTKGATANGYLIHFGAPRPFIKVEHDATGTTDIANSEIAYLGYESGSTSNIGSGGLNYYGGNGSVIRGNSIHDLYFGFYSSAVGHLIIENNQVYNNANYGLDPHTGTHDMIIRHNIVHDNGAHGIICSLNCYNVLIEDNQLYRNGKAAIMFSRNMSNSIARNNIISSEADGILVSQSNNNKIYNNTISNSQYGIMVIFDSSGNTFYSNIIKNCSHGIYSQASSNDNINNTFYNNQLINSPSAISGLQNNKPSSDIANNYNVKMHSHHTHH